MTKIIRVEPLCRVQIQAAIDGVEGRATERTVSVQDALQHVAAVDRRLNGLGVPQSERAGIATVVNGSVSLPATYGHSAQATFVTVRRNTAGWRFVEAKRTWNRASSRVLIELPFTLAQLGCWAVNATWSVGKFTTSVSTS